MKFKLAHPEWYPAKCRKGDMMAETRRLTRELLSEVDAVYWWLAECGEKYLDQSNAIRDIHSFCENILDIEEGIEQGFLDSDLVKVI
ncbi:hypothetical protein LCGC14_0717920 [marine sediment metagenome]|uniref:Uncharacterized protein n=1 Tax=marine sediment metagenome TaxID=412755 RepID=A0A0F9TKQ8_9ZZZZ